MKIAVISDIHGFNLALDRVLTAIDAEGVDRIVAAGDLCEGGPDPAGALDRLTVRGIPSVQGNTDRDISSGLRGSKTGQWTVDQLGDDRLAVLRSLPLEIRIAPPGGTSPEDDLLIVHANPFDQDRALNPSYTDRELAAMVEGTQAAVLAFGHIHISYVRELELLTLVDVSAVGNPKDGDLISRWGLFTWNETVRRWSAEIRRVTYPLAETEAQVRASGMPNPEKVLAKLQEPPMYPGLDTETLQSLPQATR